VGIRQRTVRDSISCTGIGLHSGKKVRITIKPAPPDSGIQFIRKDLNVPQVVKAHFENVIDTNLSTTLGANGVRVSTVEHLMAAFFGVGIDNALVEIDGPEVPIMDGSAAPFIFLLKSAGIREQRKAKQFIVIKKPIRIQDGNRSISIKPSRELKISFSIDFPHPLIKDQHFELNFSGNAFIREISRARTFGFLKDMKTLRDAGLAQGGSLDNAIVIDDFRILNEDGLRYHDEFVRHKILDFIGDLAIIGSPVIGHFIIERSGHSLNQALLKKLVANKGHWKRVALEKPEKGSTENLRIPVFSPLEHVPVLG
jgi:UDP-3-O-[3-hydroxymyristoyl] N-acetylglucosamine deacetylase